MVLRKLLRIIAGVSLLYAAILVGCSDNTVTFTSPASQDDPTDLRASQDSMITALTEDYIAIDGDLSTDSSQYGNYNTWIEQDYDPDTRVQSRDAALRIAIKLIAKFPTIVAAWNRIRNDQEPVPPNSDLSHAANFLYMLTGEIPDKELEAFFDVCLVLHAEHSFNASTFAVREVASTRAHMYAAVTAGVGSLSGELHGGANTRVMEMLLDIGAVEKADEFVEKVLETGGKIMGLGHAVYQVDDPRAHILAPMSKKMGERTGDTKWYDLSKALEQKGKAAFKQKKGTDIFVNVDFYSASLYYYMDIPTDLFTPVFAIARISGWAAHYIEELFGGAAPKPVLYRPESEYIGDYCGPDECTFVPLEKR